MKLIIFGATGATGLQITAQALVAGHAVTAFVRSPAKLGELATRVRIAAGDVTDRTAVEEASNGQEAAIVTLGAAIPFRRMPNLSIGMHNILMTLESAHVTRLVYLSADTVDRKRLNFLRRQVIVPLFLAATAADHELDEAMIRQSRLAWVIVRPPMLTNGAKTGHYCAGESLQAETPIPRISRADVAAFMLDQLEDDQFLRQSPSLLPSATLYSRSPRRRHDSA
jgi:putative NADH-flavin reductase